MATLRNHLPFFLTGLSDTLRMGLLCLPVLPLLAPAHNGILLLLIILLLTGIITTGGTWLTLRAEMQSSVARRTEVEQRIYEDIGLAHLLPGLATLPEHPEPLPPPAPFITSCWHLAGVLLGSAVCATVVFVTAGTALQELLPGAVVLLLLIALTAWVQAPFMGRRPGPAVVRTTGTTLAAALLLLAAVQLAGN
ncbi:MAG: hypothetical protein ACK4E8_08790 [Lacibacter sp.]